MGNRVLGHAITLWAIDTINGRISITDSDDNHLQQNPPEPWVRDVNYTYSADHEWKINHPGPCTIDYAVAVTGPVPVEPTSWGVIKAMYR